MCARKPSGFLRYAKRPKGADRLPSGCAPNEKRLPNCIFLTDPEGSHKKVKVNREVLNIIHEQDDLERLFQNEYSRHIEHLELTEERLYERALFRQQTVEETCIQKEQYNRLYEALEKLPPVQRKRIILYFWLSALNMRLYFITVALISPCM